MPRVVAESVTQTYNSSGQEVSAVFTNAAGQLTPQITYTYTNGMESSVSEESYQYNANGTLSSITDTTTSFQGELHHLNHRDLRHESPKGQSDPKEGLSSTLACFVSRGRQEPLAIADLDFLGSSIFRPARSFPTTG